MDNNDYIIPVLLSEYVKTLEDWEIVEWVSRFHETSKYHRNGATYAKYEELMKVWMTRYPEEEIPLLECVPPLDSELSALSEYRAFVMSEEEKNNG